MTVSEWITANKKRYKTYELTIATEDNKIILDDRIAYLPHRSKEYNAEWRKQCRGKSIKTEKLTAKGILLIIG